MLMDGMLDIDFNPHPVWGWTVHIEYKQKVYKISTHTPAMGWTSICRCLCRKSKITTHTPRMGDEPKSMLSSIGFRVITTHTPVWGWTFSQITFLLATFQFQPTPPYGDERTITRFPIYTAIFQPTPRMGMNAIRQVFFQKMVISTHTPVWRWTVGCKWCL